ncbi:MAG: DUF362 domain-containing protein [Ignavibacteriaceae bacterium]|jgi:uncharacterized protein (DUF362 family)|nr:DUF362 domain-containing protein [Ignavibacteriaceae bacterium]HPO56938.1 DUF362 domain-containing protein [Ignavibacteriaceae bacterium]
MDRRNFIKTGIAAGLLAGTANLQPSALHGFFSDSAPADAPFDLVAIKGGEPDAMFLKALDAMGGMKRFVKKNQKVVVKPNIGWDVVPEKAANTNPKLVSAIIRSCFDAGAKEVYVFDNTCDNWTRCYSNSGIEKAVKDAKGKLVPGNQESYYHPIELKNTKKLSKAKEHELILESDVFINVPVLKHHGSGKITVAMKNLMGIVWDRGFWHRNDLHQCIADFASYRKPDLNIVDAYNVMLQNGPRGVSVDDLVLMKSQIISTDMLAADVASAKLFGIQPENVNYIKYGTSMKIGQGDLSKLNIKRLVI